MEQAIKTSLEALNIMAESENLVAEFYLLCSEEFTEHQHFGLRWQEKNSLITE